MKKIMFSREYGLEQAVLERTKTKTRRVAVLPDGLGRGDLWNPVMGIDERGKVHFTFDCIDAKQRDLYPQYQPGEVLAVAQRYIDLKDCNAFYEALQKADPTFPLECIKGEKGCYNKMFVKAEYMPHQIRITDVGIEPLQDITDEDCLKEGIYKHNALPDALGMDRYRFISYAYDATQDKHHKRWWFSTPREAFAVLIDKTCGKGTWQRNPWTWKYEFELIR